MKQHQSLHEISRLAERQHGVLPTSAMHDAGIAGRTVERWRAGGRLVPVGRGVVRVAGAPPTFEGDVLAAILVCPCGTWASHRTAAVLWGLPGIGAGPRIDLLRAERTSHQRADAHVHGSRCIPGHHVTQLGKVPVTTMARTLFDLARSTSLDQLDRATEHAIRTRHCSITALFRVFHDLGGRGRPGTARMREVLEVRGQDYVATESELDVIGRAAVATVPGIEWQVALSDGQGYIRRVDGFHRSAGVVIEWDGAAFHDHRAQRRVDEEGDRRLKAMGLVVRRFRWSDVTLGAEGVRSELIDLIAARVRPMP